MMEKFRTRDGGTLATAPAVADSLSFVGPFGAVDVFGVVALVRVALVAVRCPRVLEVVVLVRQ